VDELDVLGTDLGNIILATIEDVLNQVPLEIDLPIFSAPICPRGLFDGAVANFTLRDLQDGDVSFEVAANPSNPTRSAKIFLSLKGKLRVLVFVTIN
jgi:hypothetical protein